MKSFFIIIAAFMLLAMIQIMPAAGSGTIRIGVQVSLTAESQAVGRDIHRGIELIIRQINDQGGLLGKKIELFGCDDQGSILKGVICAKDFINKEVMAIIGSTGEACTRAAKETYCSNKVLQIGKGASQPLMPDYCHTFLHLPVDRISLAAYAANFMIRVKSFQTIALLSDTAATKKNYVTDIKKEIVNLGGIVTAQEVIDTAALNYLPLLKQIKSTFPDAVYFSGDSRGAALIRALMIQMGIQADFIFNGGVEPPRFHQAALINAQRAYRITKTPSTLLPYDLTSAFIYDFKAAYNMETPAIESLVYIDGARALFDAVKETESTDPLILADRLHAMENFSGLSGPVTFSKPTTPIGNSYSTWQYHSDGSREIVHPVFKKAVATRPFNQLYRTGFK